MVLPYTMQYLGYKKRWISLFCSTT